MKERNYRLIKAIPKLVSKAPITASPTDCGEVKATIPTPAQIPQIASAVHFFKLSPFLEPIQNVPRGTF